MRCISFALGAFLALAFSAVIEANPKEESRKRAAASSELSPRHLQPLQPTSVGDDIRSTAEAPPRKAHSRGIPSDAAASLEPAQKALATLHRLNTRREARHLFATGVTTRQRDALAALSSKADAADDRQIRISRKNGIPTFIRSGSKPMAHTEKRDDEGRTEAALGFMQKNAGAFRLQDPANELALKRMRADRRGKHHYLFQQHVNGVPVRGAQVAVHFNAEGELYAMNARTEPSLMGLHTEPEFGADRAAWIAGKALNGAPHDVSNIELQIRKRGGRYQLVYDVETRVDGVNRWRTVINARNGRVMEHFLDHHSTDVNASGADLEGKTRTFSAWQQGGLNYMIDITTPVKTFDEDPLNQVSDYGDTHVVDFAGTEGQTQLYVTSNSPSSGWDAAAISALHNAKLAFTYFRDTHSHVGIDGAEGNLFLGVHFGTDLDNAFWSGGWMVFGDGGAVFGNLARCLDVVGHEMSHGVIEATANLIYENQSGALNESIADFFGVMIERKNWRLGEDCTIQAPGFLRDMTNPHQGLSSQPRHMSEFVYMPNTPDTDHGGVHINSGIPNRAAYLLAEGLSAEDLGTSIGLEKTEALYYRTLSTYLVSSSQFIDLRRGMLLAADDLYAGDSGVRKSINDAFDAVGIVEGDEGAPDDSTPSGSEVAAGDDLLFYLYPVDDTYDDIYEIDYGFDVYMQVLDKPFSGYNEEADLFLGNSMTPVGARPVAFTDEHGTVALYVGNDGNVYWIDPSGEYKVTDDGSTWSIAVSHNGTRLALTTFLAGDNHIHLLDTVSGEIKSHELKMADYQPDAVTSGSRILYADALDFNYLGNKVVFDALVCVPTPTADCDSEDHHGFWTIGILDLKNGTMRYPFKGQSADYHIGFPVFAQNREHIIAFDSVGKLENGNYDTGT